jgi:hypothetical protein
MACLMDDSAFTGFYRNDGAAQGERRWHRGAATAEAAAALLSFLLAMRVLRVMSMRAVHRNCRRDGIVQRTRMQRERLGQRDGQPDRQEENREANRVAHEVAS